MSLSSVSLSKYLMMYLAISEDSIPSLFGKIWRRENVSSFSHICISHMRSTSHEDDKRKNGSYRAVTLHTRTPARMRTHAHTKP